jgi:hypothetical protein
MAVPTPMVIRLYDVENEYEEFTRLFVPWKLLKVAVRLSKELTLDPDNISEEDADALASLVVEVFGNQFTIEDLNEKADISDMISVLQTIVSKATGSNPTLPG